ncbi:XRE family transcriptional regulator [Virgisporangium aurantiacum]|uniref:XRE family transcriptional regulator n=1 Tax=Virgisporangium aurantiacum TaxID=175570 RepID=UPI0019522093|nr:XRE family transcriptional regulator [Virgisporangium aurantiacum]
MARLAQHRRLDIGALAQEAQVEEPALQNVLAGSAPEASLLRRIAPALGLHVADVFVLAGLPVPDDLAAWDERAADHMDGLAYDAIRLRAERRQELRSYVRSLADPVMNRCPPALKAHEQYEPNAGGVLVRMLHNRNLTWSASAKILYDVGGVGPLSASTIGVIGHGRKELTSELLIGFAIVLAIPAVDLAVLLRMELPSGAPPVRPSAADVAELIWDARRLDAGQVARAAEYARRGRLRSRPISQEGTQGQD